MKNILAAFVVLLLLPVVVPISAWAQTAPDPSKYPVLEKIKAQATGGGKDLTFDYMGQTLGFDAWMVSG